METGACFCGAVAAEMRGEPFWICFDHDDDCRRALGSPLAIWVGYRPDQFRLNSRDAEVVLENQRRGPNVLPRVRHLDQLFGPRLADELYLTIGFFDRPERFAPQAHAYWRMRLPWLDFADDLPRVDGYSRDRDPDFGDPADR